MILMIILLLMMNRRIPVMRRYTGGGTVVVDENTAFVTFIMNVIAMKYCLRYCCHDYLLLEVKLYTIS